MNIQQRRGGFYWVEKDPYLSVTTILSGSIPKPALQYWYGQQVYYATIKDPSIDEKTALSAPYKKSESATGRGKLVHSVVEAFKNTGEHIESIPIQFQGYVTAFYDFMRDHKPELLEQEKKVMDEENLVAGTLDLYIKLGESYMVIDVKTGKDIYPETALQLSAYAKMLRDEGKRVDAVGVLLLETGADDLPTGKYKFQVMEERFDVFLSCLEVYKFLNLSKLTKVGYRGIV